MPRGETAPPGNQAPLPLAAEVPLPACARTVNVAEQAAWVGALERVEAGDCLVLADGAYQGVTITARGRAEAPIVIRARHRLAATLTGQLVLRGAAHVVIEGLSVTGGSIELRDASHCRLTRIKFSPVVDRAEDWVTIDGDSHHNRIDHGDFGPKTELGNILMLGGRGTQVVRHNRIDHNYFHDVKGGGGNGWETIRLGLSKYGPSRGDNLIERNLFRAATGDPETISVKSSYNTVRYNTYRATRGEITLRHGNGTQVYGNFLLADGEERARGIRVLGADHRIHDNHLEGITGSPGILLRAGSADGTDENGREHYRVYRTVVRNNTLLGSRGIVVGGNNGLPPVSCVIAFNRVEAPHGEPILDLGELTRLEGNLTGGSGISGAGLIAAGMRSDLGAPRAAPPLQRPLTEADVGPAAP